MLASRADNICRCQPATQPGSGKAKESFTDSMPIPSRVSQSDLWHDLCRARKGVGSSLVEGLRDVPIPRETESGGEGPTVWIHQRTLWSCGRKWPRPVRYPITKMNRERELGLDRRETG
jgi:hypothetical protein